MAKIKDAFETEIEVNARLADEPNRPAELEMGPSKNGSRYCANARKAYGGNGSIASGGTNEYCTCDVCF